MHTDWNRFTLEVPFDDTSYLSIDTSIHALPTPMQEHRVFVDDVRFNIGSHFVTSTSANQWHAFMTLSLHLDRLPKVIFTFDGHGAANVMARRNWEVLSRWRECTELSYSLRDADDNFEATFQSRL